MFLGLVAVVAVAAAAKFHGPVSTLRGQAEELAELRMKKAALVSEQAQLERYKHYLATEAGQEAAARRQGYVKEGERRLVFFREETGEAEGKAKTEGDAPTS